MLQRRQVDSPYPGWNRSTEVVGKEEILAQLMEMRWQVAELDLQEVGQLLAVAQLALRENISKQA